MPRKRKMTRAESLEVARRARWKGKTKAERSEAGRKAANALWSKIRAALDPDAATVRDALRGHEESPYNPPPKATRPRRRRRSPDAPKPRRRNRAAA